MAKLTKAQAKFHEEAVVLLSKGKSTRKKCV